MQRGPVGSLRLVRLCKRVGERVGERVWARCVASCAACAACTARAGVGVVAVVGLPVAWVAGVVALLVQPQLQAGAVYGAWVAGAAALLMTGLGLWWGVARALDVVPRALPRALPRVTQFLALTLVWILVLACVLCSAAVLGYAHSGLRGVARAQQAIAPEMQGRTLWVRGQVASLVHTNERVTRWQFEVTHVYAPHDPAQDVPRDVLQDRPQDGPQAHRTTQAATVDDAALLPSSAWVAWPASVSLSWYHRGFDGALTHALGESAPAVLPAQTWLLPVRLKAPHGKRNPHGFDWELHAWAQGISAVGYVAAKPEQVPVLLRAREDAGADAGWGVGWSGRWLLWRDATRQRIDAALAQQPRVAGLLKALVVGDQQAIDSDDWALFRDTGVAHLVSISGLHITMFAWLAHTVLWWLWRAGAAAGGTVSAPKRWSGAGLRAGVTRCMARLAARVNVPVTIAGCAALLAWAYALFAGWGVPAQRTVLMLLVWVGLKAVGLRWPWPVVWLWVLAVVVAWDPWAMLSAGFWLSFVAVATLLGIASQPRPVAVTWGQRLRLELGAMWQVQWRLSVVLAPLTWLLFGQVSVVGVLANVVAIPLVSVVVLPMAMVGVLVPWAWVALAPVLHLMLQGLTWAQQWPWAVAQPPALPLWLAAWVALAVLVQAWPWPLHWRVQWAWVGVLALLYTPARPDPGEFDMLAFDVGQGSAVLVRTHTRSLLFDAGPRYGRGSDAPTAADSVIVPHLRATADALDAVVLSHADNDHVGGAQAVLASGLADGAVVWSSFAPSQLAQRHDPPPNDPNPNETNANEPNANETKLQALSATHVSKYWPCVAPHAWQWDGVWFEWMSPDASVLAANGWPSPQVRLRNAQSCVLRVSNAHGVLWLMADVGKAQEAAIAQRLAAREPMATRAAGASAGDAAMRVRPGAAPIAVSHAVRADLPTGVMTGASKGASNVAFEGASQGASEGTFQGASEGVSKVVSKGRAPVVVLVAGHHGSATSSSEAWLRFVRPDWVVAQAGYANPYGHPSAEVVQRLQMLAPLWRMQWRDTAHCGAALWRSADAQHLHCEREARPKHWQHRP
jgi:competence protein ComEC